MIARLIGALAVAVTRLACHLGHHAYLSTGCLHGDHDYCQSMTGLNGAKRPASCKKCSAPCQCFCHH